MLLLLLLLLTIVAVHCDEDGVGIDNNIYYRYTSLIFCFLVYSIWMESLRRQLSKVVHKKYVGFWYKKKVTVPTQNKKYQNP